MAFDRHLATLSEVLASEFGNLASDSDLDESHIFTLLTLIGRIETVHPETKSSMDLWLLREPN